MKNKILIIFIFSVLLIVSIYMCLKNFEKTKEANKEKFNIDITAFKVKDRAKLIIGQTVLIGNNLNELQNNFYDVKLENTLEGINIYLNKLWYSEYDNTFIQDEYLANICREIVNLIEEAEIEEFEYNLYKYIKENFLKIKKGEKIEGFKYNNLNVTSQCVQGECVLNIKRE